ncbi:hypothetical protein M0813_23705 [Anaeramoeba flamelloides]|uniref:Leucine-rich repeat protein n=1 Tax=Anaeramoeba flamelloides TaxID=1746091 RepID=A0ABQ8Y8U2_9EUKA|nr:hypothetical protein M0813_23705 [Anaeramoeba flamelloides]
MNSTKFEEYDPRTSTTVLNQEEFMSSLHLTFQKRSEEIFNGQAALRLSDFRLFFFTSRLGNVRSIVPLTKQKNSQKQKQKQKQNQTKKQNQKQKQKQKNQQMLNEEQLAGELVYYLKRVQWLKLEQGIQESPLQIGKLFSNIKRLQITNCDLGLIFDLQHLIYHQLEEVKFVSNINGIDFNELLTLKGEHNPYVSPLNRKKANKKKNKKNEMPKKKLCKLHTLRAIKANLQEIPSTIKSIKSLTNLDLQHNSIPQIANLNSNQLLRKVDLSYNLLSSIKSVNSWEFGNIEILCLRGNKIKDISWLGNVPNLKIVDLKNNLIEKFSQLYVFHKFIRLKELMISGNPISSIPNSRELAISCLVTRKQNKLFNHNNHGNSINRSNSYHQNNNSAMGNSVNDRQMETCVKILDGREILEKDIIIGNQLKDSIEEIEETIPKFWNKVCLRRSKFSKFKSNCAQIINSNNNKSKDKISKTKKIPIKLTKQWIEKKELKMDVSEIRSKIEELSDEWPNKYLILLKKDSQFTTRNNKKLY